MRLQRSVNDKFDWTQHNCLSLSLCNWMSEYEIVNMMYWSDSSSFGGKYGFAACCPHRFFRSCKYIWNYKCEVFVNVITAKCEWQLSLSTVQPPLSLFALYEWIWNRQHILMYKRWTRQILRALGAKMAVLPVAPIVSSKAASTSEIINAKYSWMWLQLNVNDKFDWTQHNCLFLSLCNWMSEYEIGNMMDSSDSSSFGGKDGCAACCPHRFFRSCKYIWNDKCEVFMNVITATCEWQVSLNIAQQPLCLFAIERVNMKSSTHIDV